MDWRDEPDQLGRWRPGTFPAAAVAGLLLAAAVAVLLFGGNDAADQTAALPTDAGPGPGGPVEPDPARAAQGSGPESGPLLTAPAVRWELVSGVAVPVSPTAGPSRLDGAVHSGFERSQTGALIAATQISTRAAFTPGDGWRQVAQAQLLPGVGRDVFIRRRGTVTTIEPPGTFGQYAGFRIVAATPDVTVVQLVSRFGSAFSGHLQLVTYTVKWVAGDWRLELQPDSGFSPSVQQIPNLDGFVVWGGV